MDLTDADRRAAYAAQARSMRTKGCEEIEVTFRRDGGGDAACGSSDGV
ncbi:MAG: hypothetical protein IPM00_15650 [Tetrasphaera sp.]|nr:hypothetical protein [Tetrasphaera sp.]